MLHVKTIIIILLRLAGYEMIITNSALRASLVIITSYPAHPRVIINNYFMSERWI